MSRSGTFEWPPTRDLGEKLKDIANKVIDLNTLINHQQQVIDSGKTGATYGNGSDERHLQVALDYRHSNGTERTQDVLTGEELRLVLVIFQTRAKKRLQALSEEYSTIVDELETLK